MIFFFVTHGFEKLLFHFRIQAACRILFWILGKFEYIDELRKELLVKRDRDWIH